MTHSNTITVIDEEPLTPERRAAQDVVQTIIEHGHITIEQLEALLSRYGLSSDPHSERSIVRDLVNTPCPDHWRHERTDVITYLCGDHQRLTSNDCNASLTGDGAHPHPPQT